MKKIPLLIALVVFCPGCATPPDESFVGPKVSLLFVGNSYTYVNDLPRTIVELARSGRHEIFADSVAPGGWTLSQHANSKDTLAKIAGKKWDFVVLQEQSIVPAVEQERSQQMLPAIRYLDYQIRKAGARSLLYLTWGRQNGMAEIGYKDFDSMQAQLTEGTMGIAKELHLEVAPVGVAWKTAHDRESALKLWQGDGSHPTVEGTYLAACVFYADLYQKSPEGLKYRAGLPEETAKLLQEIASETVLTDPARWNIPVNPAGG